MSERPYDTIDAYIAQARGRLRALPEDLIRRIVRHRVAENLRMADKRAAGRKRG